MASRGDGEADENGRHPASPAAQMIFPTHHLCEQFASDGFLQGVGANNPAGSGARLWMRVVASVLRRPFVREGLVVTYVVFIEIVACGSANDWGRHAQIADERGNGDVKHIVAKAPPVGPATGDDSAEVERTGERAGKHIGGGVEDA